MRHLLELVPQCGTNRGRATLALCGFGLLVFGVVAWSLQAACGVDECRGETGLDHALPFILALVVALPALVVAARRPYDAG